MGEGPTDRAVWCDAIRVDSKEFHEWSAPQAFGDIVPEPAGRNAAVGLVKYSKSWWGPGRRGGTWGLDKVFFCESGWFS